MNNSQQAKNGFKTFVFTLLLSLGTFGAFYYLTTSPPAKQTEIKNPTGSKTTSLANKSTSPKTTQNEPKEEQSKASAFEELSKTKMEVEKKVILGGTSQTTESTVPDTGATSITTALIFSLVTISLGTYILYLGPRKWALSRFENDISKSVD